MTALSRLSHSFFRYTLPVVSVGSLAYAGREVYLLYHGREESPETILRRQMERETVELDQKRVEWVEQARAAPSGRLALFVADVIGEVHRMDALGPAGIRLKDGETVSVLEDGQGMNVGFYIVKGSDDGIGIYPKAYLRQKVEGASE
eukprot:TRINITY_DN8409_c0_g1_i1.p1 TRINITY_DN8409_c0_g1~~TRINITY_DN8409_c0_g1_i1.p1  ORF type:complete len:147 (-),score=23.68 TRINITY_DN8409_c0_g1_i1:69-509(-)